MFALRHHQYVARDEDGAVSNQQAAADAQAAWAAGGASQQRAVRIVQLKREVHYWKDIANVLGSDKAELLALLPLLAEAIERLLPAVNGPPFCREGQLAATARELAAKHQAAAVTPPPPSASP